MEGCFRLPQLLFAGLVGDSCLRCKPVAIDESVLEHRKCAGHLTDLVASIARGKFCLHFSRSQPAHGVCQERQRPGDLAAHQQQGQGANRRRADQGTQGEGPGDRGGQPLGDRRARSQVFSLSRHQAVESVVRFGE